MSRSRSIARLIVLILLLVCLAGVLAISRIDPNSYREEIAEALSDLIEQPVGFGRISYSMQQGLAIDCQDLSIAATKSAPFSLGAQHLYLKLEIMPLLRGQLVLRQLILDHPRLHVDLRRAETSAPQPTKSNGHPMTANLREVLLKQGDISLRWPGSSATEAPLQLHNVDIRLQERSAKRLDVEVGGVLNLDGNESALTLSGEIDTPWVQTELDRNRLDLNIKAERLPLARVAKKLQLAQLQLTGNAFFSARLKGSPAAGLQFQTTLTSTQASYRIASGEPRAIGQWRLSGTWQRPSPGHQLLQELTLIHDDLQVQGRIELLQQELSANLSLKQASLSSWLKLIPESVLPVQIYRHAQRGSITAKLQLQPTALSQIKTGQAFRHLQVDAELGDLAWPLEGLPALEQGSARLHLADGTVQIQKLQATWAGRPQQATGSISLNDPPQLNLQGTLHPPLRQLHSHLPAELAPKLELAGEVPIQWSLKGRPDQFTIGLDARLTDLAGSYQGWYAKEAGDTGRLQAKLSKAGKNWTLTGGELELGDEKLSAKGQWGQDQSWNLGLQGTDLALEPLLKEVHFLIPHRIRGAVGLDLALGRTPGRSITLTGRLQLRDVGVHLTHSLADLQKINGTVLLTGMGFKTVLLNARLGESPVTLQTHLDDFSRPELKLHLQGKSVRAHELIFPSETDYLRDLDGRITIAARGIDFDFVKVRLDGGTECTVTGAMTGWHQPHVALKIEAPYADIAEVIALWHHPVGIPPEGTPAKSSPPPQHQGPTVAIDAHVGKGKLNRLKIEKTSGTITSNGRGRLSIAPLQFHSGEGFGSGQVIVESGSDHPTQLKISGHVENFPAEGIHRDLLQRESLLTGTLRGDFYLEGLAGEDFIKTSHGGINIEVHDGVLKRFQVLSKLFSLLNVSQLFSLQLPDMAEQGMPFKKIDGTFGLLQGLLNTENLLVHSEAMDLSMIGDYDLADNRIDAILGVKPLKTVDKIITKIPIAGWILTGKEKALITAHFTVKGPADDPEVFAVPVTSLSNKVFGIFKRVLTLPGKLITEPDKVILPQSANPKE